MIIYINTIYKKLILLKSLYFFQKTSTLQSLRLLDATVITLYIYCRVLHMSYYNCRSNSIIHFPTL